MQSRHPRARWLLLVAVSFVGAQWGFAEQPAFKTGPWPFCPPVRPEVPVVADHGWVANPLDAFILAALEEKGLRPNGPADKLTLLRRVTFDLTGLAPTVAEQHDFLADESPDAFARVVDRLLDSPHYGERWAQHWLDIVRYAESDGFKSDDLRPAAHRYRDYVIRAFNADLPYDRFIRQQLAGDEFEPDNLEALVATGLNRLYPDESNAANVMQRRQEIRDELTDNTALTFLGLTVGCAQCHDHKFDPITQVDFFRLQAFFAPMLPQDETPLASHDEQQRHDEQKAVWESTTADIRAEMESLLAGQREAVMNDGLEKFDPSLRDCVLTAPEERTSLQQQLAFQMMRYIRPKLGGLADNLKGPKKERYETLEKQLAEFDQLKPAALPTAMTVIDAAGPAPATHRLAVGDHRKPLEEVQPGFPAFLGNSEPAIAPRGSSSGRRAALADWLCRADHPLTARVMVNRIWQHHFGEGIVATPNDFGAMGQPASHPELLDWLAVEFVERGWSVKEMHRLMVTSATYRQSSLVDLDRPEVAKALEVDGQNRLLWHARRRRLESEAIRDVMLQLSAQLNERMFGKSAQPELPPGMDQTASWKPDKNPHDRQRRSIYVLARRNLRYPLLDVFDMPDMHNSCAQRPRTTTAPQALTLMNGEFTLEQARAWSGRLLVEHGADEGAAIRAAFQQAFSRAPTDYELTGGQRFLADQAASIDHTGDATAADTLPHPIPPNLEPAKSAAWVDFCHALLNSNELVYLD